MQLPAGIGKHGETVELVLGGILADLEATLGLPVLAGFPFYRFRIVVGSKAGG
jgi:hypothetical protein